MKEANDIKPGASDVDDHSFMLRWKASRNDAERSLIRSEREFGLKDRPGDQGSALAGGDGNFADRVFQPKREFATSYLVVKRCMDFSLAVIMLVALIPVFLFIAFVLRTGGSPVIFSHKRVGQSGRLFNCYKFRTMKVDAERELAKILKDNPEKRREWFKTHKLEDDPRITRIGRFLRKTSLDELPQFMNVIRGEMSLVGPRPIVVKELAKYGSFADHYLSVKPGLTGLWQISGRNNTTYHRRVALDTAYVRHASLGFDLNILLRSALPILSGYGAR